MIDLDDANQFTNLLDITVLWACSYSNITPTDRERREQYRRAAKEKGKIGHVPHALWWAVRIDVVKAGRMLDIDNVPKVAIDAFCIDQINRDGSAYPETGIYPHDTLDCVRVLQVTGKSGDESSTRIEVFACVAENTG